MASLREIRRKIKSVKSTEQITKAMKMVAAARMRRSQSAILASRPFAVKMEELVRRLSVHESLQTEAQDQAAPLHPFFEKRADGPAALLLVTADKGLCGAFNSSLFRATVDWLGANRGRKVYISVVGRKGRDFLRRLNGFDFEIVAEMAGIFPKVQFTHAEIIGKTLMDAFKDKGLSSVTMLYNEFKSVAVQRVVSAALLPIPAFVSAEPAPATVEYGFEPGRRLLLEGLLPRYIKAQIYRVLLESQAAELAARMNAMDAASKNAKELRQSLNLGLNRRRQAIITGEIAELVGGAEALAS